MKVYLVTENFKVNSENKKVVCGVYPSKDEAIEFIELIKEEIKERLDVDEASYFEFNENRFYIKELELDR